MTCLKFWQISFWTFFSWIDENRNVVSCLILPVKVVKVMLIWFPCVVMKECDEKWNVFNKRMTNWGFGMSKSTIVASSTRHQGFIQKNHYICIFNHVTFNQLCVWCDLCGYICLLINSFQSMPNFLWCFQCTYTLNLSSINVQYELTLCLGIFIFPCNL
jgi:hypothetical protein